jgi:hypothetical protein
MDLANSISANSIRKGKERAKASLHHLTAIKFATNMVLRATLQGTALVLLYQQSLKKEKSDKPSFEAHFNLAEASTEVVSSSLASTELKNTLAEENLIAVDNKPMLL